MFSRFETTSRQERKEIAYNLAELYEKTRELETETWLSMRDAPTEKEYNDAQKNHLYELGKLTAIQTVFHDLGIPFD